ncbi:hypothetical protein Pmani_002160 [Petrolisthes manimaculis]|uniref:BAG family molecular chaperone regulator 1 n=1 Tax=Petrolisthes manimaculis TaxID=1843537 RepID=A0AAE1QJ57_9EUCA|nr:hypothetical protein Pmani_002160 [Petrolisthes manimaculis]
MVQRCMGWITVASVVTADVTLLFLRLFKQSSSNMGDREYPIILCHGPTKHELIVSGDMTVQDLVVKVEEVTQVPRGHQKILHKGRNLVNSSSNLSQLGVGHGAKVMILGKISPQRTEVEEEEEDKESEAIRKIDMSCTGLETTLNEVITNVNCIERNFDTHSRGEALGRFRKKSLGINEEFMRLLEQLDGLELQENAKVRRKCVVRRIQTLMEKSDRLHDQINNLRVKYP